MWSRRGEDWDRRDSGEKKAWLGQWSLHKEPQCRAPRRANTRATDRLSTLFARSGMKTIYALLAPLNIAARIIIFLINHVSHCSSTLKVVIREEMNLATNRSALEAIRYTRPPPAVSAARRYEACALGSWSTESYGQLWAYTCHGVGIWGRIFNNKYWKLGPSL